MKLVITLLPLIYLSSKVEGACDYCQSQNLVACHSETVFSLCINGIATSDYITCPENHVCTEGFEICYPRESTIASCRRIDIMPQESDNQCGLCNSKNRVFSCIDETTIAFCFGGATPSRNAVVQCPANTVCDLNAVQGFCSDSEQVVPSCREITAVESTTTTTVAVSITPTEAEDSTTTKDLELTTPKTADPNAICRSKASTGFHKLENDVTCVQYLYCYQALETFAGLIYQCQSGQYFDDKLRVCTTEKPSGCL